MHQLSLLSIGKVKTAWIQVGCEVFTERLRHFCHFTERILSPRSKQEENDKLLKALEKAEGTIVILSHIGKEYSSEEFSVWLGKQKDQGTSVTFILSGAYGADERVMSRGHMVLSLSRMTLPHELCKLVFLEQLYRAETILAGSGYHH